MAAIPRVFLHAGQERRIALGHPWAYSNEIRMDAGAKSLTPGTLATLHRSDGRPLGVGSFNPHTLIAFRVFDPDAATVIDEAFFGRRLRQAMRLRDRLFPEPYYRLAHAEADGLPGLVCDRFGDVLVLQMNTAGIEALAAPVLASQPNTGATAIAGRSSSAAHSAGSTRGMFSGKPPPVMWAIALTAPVWRIAASSGLT